MKTSQLIIYLQNEIRKHGDKECRVVAIGDDEIVVENNIVVVTKNNLTEIKVSR